MTRPVLWFVTPAWQRYAMTAICLEQRARVIAVLESAGIEAHQVIVADDENLDIARGLGAAVVERPNDPRQVGRRFNDGIEYAGRYGGADWIVPIGSDSWVDPTYFLPLLPPGQTLTSAAYCAVEAHRMAELRVAPMRPNHSAGPYVFHWTLLAAAYFRPSADVSDMVDTSTITGITRTARRPINWRTRTRHPYQYVGFRVPPLMTTYYNLARRWLVHEHDDPWSVLAEHYPADLVDRARAVMGA